MAPWQFSTLFVNCCKLLNLAFEGGLNPNMKTLG
jgi:hypothetical protein